jgi:hypothetical protein
VHVQVPVSACWSRGPLRYPVGPDPDPNCHIQAHTGTRTYTSALYSPVSL